jgi:hypothetical protein
VTKLSCICVFAITLFLPSAVSAQYDYYASGGFSFNQNNYPDISGHKWKKPGATQKEERQAVPRSSDDKTSTPTNTNVKIPTFPLPYTRNQALSDKIQSEFLVDLAGRGTANDVRQMAAMMAQNDFVQVYAGLAKLQGLDSGTPEGLTALFYGQTWAIANKLPLPTSHQYQAIAKQFRDTNARARLWDKINNSQRQTIIERLAYPMIVQKANYEAYRRDGRTDAIADMAKRVQEGMKSFDMDMQATKLTNAGFDKLPEKP